MSRITLIALLGTLCLGSAKAWPAPPELRQLTDDRYLNGYSEWSPDGSRIVFTSTRNGAPDLYVMKVDLERIKKDLKKLNEG